jgi:hypothetical protein
VRAFAIAFLALWFIPVAAYASSRRPQAAAHSRIQSAQGSAGKSHKTFRNERLGVEFEYPASYELAKLSAQSPQDAPPESLLFVASYKLVPSAPPGGGRSETAPYARRYYVFFLKLDLAEAAKAMGFARNSQGDWMPKNGGGSSKGVQVSGNGWQGLRITYPLQLYRAPTPQERAHGFEVGSTSLGMSEGEKTLLNWGGDLSMVLEFDPDIGTDSLRDVILKSLRFSSSTPSSGKIK